MSVGVPSIDEDHKRLITLINRFEDLTAHSPDLYGKDEGAMRTLLGSLAAYAREHFAREERMQATAEYPGLPENRAEHQRLTKSLAAMIVRFQDRPSSEPEITPAEMVHFLQTWLVEHVIKCDLKMRGYKFPKGAW